MTTPDNRIEACIFPDDGRTPNHPALPLVIMRETAAADADDPAAWFEEKFVAHGWGATWRWGVYPYHHFHTTNHEVLGVSRGEATLMLGGENGAEYQVKSGDVIVIPAGVSHKCVEATKDFQVVGAYPRGKEPDLIRPENVDIAAATAAIAEVPFPEQDPIHGPDGPLFDHWKNPG
jgi:uncharacterized protein YjlB